MKDSLYQQLVATQEAMLTQLQMMHMTQQSLQQRMETPLPAAPVAPMPTGMEPLAQPELRQGTQQNAQHEPLLGQPVGGSAQPFEKAAPVDGFGARLSHSVPLGELTEDVLNNRAYIMGGESLQQHHSELRQRVQMGTMNAIGGTAETAVGIGAFLAPGGLIASTAVGMGVGAVAAYGVDQMMDGAKEALVYQNILEQKGYRAFNVFEGQNDFGGVGMTLDQQQELSGFLRDLAPEKLLKDDELAKILDGSLDGKLLKSTTDIASFKKKFASIVDSVKEVAVVMNASLDEATKMLGELESRGISSTRATMLASQAKVNASLQGVSAEQAWQDMLGSSDMLTAGSGMAAEKAMSAAGGMQYVTSSLYEQYKETDPDRYNYIKNNGGESGIAAQATDILYNGLASTRKDLLISQVGFAVELDEDGNVTLDGDKIDAMARGEYGDAQAVYDAGVKAVSQLDPAQVEQLMNTVGELTKSELSSDQNAAVLRSILEYQRDTTGRTPEAALQEMGLAKDTTMASILVDQLYNMTPDNADTFAALATREGLAAIDRVESPGIFARFRAGWDKAVSNPLGDVGQFVSDGIGDIGLDLQKALSNVGSSEGVRSDLLVDPADYREQMFEGDDSIVARYNADIADLLVDTDKKADPDSAWDLQRGAKRMQTMQKNQTGQITADEAGRFTVDFRAPDESSISLQEFYKLKDRAIKRDLDLSELARLREVAKTGDRYEAYRADVLVKLGSGEMGDEKINTMDLADDEEWNAQFDDGVENGKASLDEARKLIKTRTTDILEGQKADLDKAYAAAQKLDLAPEDAESLERAIRTRDVEAVRAITQDKDVLGAMDAVEAANLELKKANDASSGLASFIDNGLAIAESAERTTGLFREAGLDKEQVGLLFAPALDAADKLRKGIKDGSLSNDEVLALTQETVDATKAGFASVSDKDVAAFAQAVADLNPEDKYDEKYFLNESGALDRDKVMNAVPQIIVDGSKKGADGVSPTNKGEKELTAHEEALGGFLETVTKETAMIKEAQKRLKNGQPYQYTSLT